MLYYPKQPDFSVCLSTGTALLHQALTAEDAYSGVTQTSLRKAALATTDWSRFNTGYDNAMQSDEKTVYQVCGATVQGYLMAPKAALPLQVSEWQANVLKSDLFLAL